MANDSVVSAMDDPSYTEARGRAMAETVLGKTLGVRPGESVTIETWTSTIPWALAFVRAARRMGAHPILIYEDESSFWKSLEESKPATVGSIGRHELALLEKTDAYVFFFGPSDTARFEALDEKLHNQLTAFQDPWYAVANRNRLRFARMYLGRVGRGAAHRYHISAREWSEELVEGTLVDPAPMHAAGTKIAHRLERGEVVRVTESGGTDLELRLKHRRPFVFSGMYLPETPARHGRGAPWGMRETPIPAGVVSVAVDEAQGSGTFVANAPTKTRDNPWSGARWEFADGHLVSHRYASGQAAFGRSFSAGRRGKDQPGILSIGLNPKIHEAPMMVDQELGTVTLSLGSNRFMGGTTDAHFFTWASVRGADVTVDDVPIVKRGRLVVE